MTVTNNICKRIVYTCVSSFPSFFWTFLTFFFFHLIFSFSMLQILTLYRWVVSWRRAHLWGCMDIESEAVGEEGGTGVGCVCVLGGGGGAWMGLMAAGEGVLGGGGGGGVSFLGGRQAWTWNSPEWQPTCSFSSLLFKLQSKYSVWVIWYSQTASFYSTA